jgi:hypothetical protein
MAASSGSGASLEKSTDVPETCFEERISNLHGPTKNKKKKKRHKPKLEEEDIRSACLKKEQCEVWWKKGRPGRTSIFQ